MTRSAKNLTLSLTRRDALRGAAIPLATTAFANLAPIAGELPLSVETADLPIIQITSGSTQTWFGYYDKEQIDHTGRFALGGRVANLFRPPQPDDIMEIGIIDLEDNFAWRTIGHSRAWSWQQGAMLQWVPGERQMAIWNDRQEDHFVSRIYDMATGEMRTLPRAIYTLTPDGKAGLSLDFARLQILRPGYGYPTERLIEHIPNSPSDDGVWKMDLTSGESELLVSMDRLADLLPARDDGLPTWNWVNHLLVNTMGDRFIFLHRFRNALLTQEMRESPEWLDHYNNFQTQAITADLDGKNLFLLNDTGFFSHFAWRDRNHIAAFAKATTEADQKFYIFRDKTQAYQVIDHAAMPDNGHNTYVPNTNKTWILNDTYPLGEERLMTLYLFHAPSRRKVILGRFHRPAAYATEWRLDLHPRCDQEGKRVFFDSVHSGVRQIYMVDISSIVSDS